MLASAILAKKMNCSEGKRGPDCVQDTNMPCIVTFSSRKCLSLRASEDLLGRLARSEIRGLAGRTLHGPETTPPPVLPRSLLQFPITSTVIRKEHQRRISEKMRGAGPYSTRGEDKAATAILRTHNKSGMVGHARTPQRVHM